MRTLKGTRDFEKILLESIDEGLKVLGESGKHMVFFYLERNCSIRKCDIPKNPEAFVRGLEKIFGAGAPVLEKMILRCMYSKLGLKYEEGKEQRFIDCIKEATAAITQPSESSEEQDKPANFMPKMMEGYQAESKVFVVNKNFETYF
jgi:hypothetical protein